MFRLLIITENADTAINKFLLIAALFVTQSQAQNIYTDDYYSNILEAENHIIRSEYLEAIQSMTIALRIKQLPTHRVNTYINLINTNKDLNSKYLDTIIYYSFQHGSYESIRKISQKINVSIDELENNHIRNVKYEKSKKFVFKIDSLLDEDQRLRKESKIKNQGKIYVGEYKYKIRQIDSIHHIEVYKILSNNGYNEEVGYLVDQECLALWQHLLVKMNDTTTLRLEKQLERLALQGWIDKYFTADFLYQDRCTT